MRNIKDFYNLNPFPGVYNVKDFTEQQKHKDNAYINFILDSCKDKTTVLDIGCGTGYISNFLASANKQLKITAIDFSVGVQTGKEMAKRLKNKNIKWIQADFLNHDFKQKFDLVLCQGVLHHMPEYKLALSKMKNLIKKNGVLLLGIYNKWVKRFQKILPLQFFKSKVLKIDQMKCPFEVAFDRNEISAMADDMQITSSYPRTLKYFPNVHLLWKANSGGLTTFKLERRKHD